MCSTGAGFLGVGMALPERIVTNDEISQKVDTNNDWIVARTGICERRICGPDENSATLGISAARRALDNAGISPDEIDMVICATATGVAPWPSTACLIQDAIGAKNAGAFDLSAACSGFVYGIATASALIQNGTHRYVLVVGVDTLSKQADWSDRGTCILFGDGAGAALLGPCEANHGVIASSLNADGSGFKQIFLDGDTPDHNPSAFDGSTETRPFIRMKGAEVFKFAVRIMGDICLDALAKAGLKCEDISLLVPHQANIRIITAAAERMNLPEDHVFVNVHKYGNTSAASIPIALTEALESKRIKRGDVLVFAGFGAGLTWGSTVIRWNRDEN